ncbi:hypothetical protein NPIL_610091, partial [Nephila pilipes]
WWWFWVGWWRVERWFVVEEVLSSPSFPSMSVLGFEKKMDVRGVEAAWGCGGWRGLWLVSGLCWGCGVVLGCPFGA